MIKSLAYVEVLKNTTSLSLILQIPTRECALNYNLLLALLFAPRKYNNSTPTLNLLWLSLINMIIIRLIEHIAAAAEDIASSTINVDHKVTTAEAMGSAEVPVKRSATFVRS
jgi:hypothetical protein